MTLRRLDHILASSGYGSRKDASKMIRAKRVQVDGEVVRDSATKVDPTTVTVDGMLIDHPLGIAILLHKPVGHVCSHDSDEGPRVYDLLPSQWMMRNPKPVTAGRLDKDTTGALIITDDTLLAHRLSSGKREVEKCYEAEVDTDLGADLARTFAAGTIVLKDEAAPCLPARFEPVSARVCRVSITEGRYHQVKRMFAALGYHVTRLHRLRFGPFTVDGLAEGTWRDLTEEELRACAPGTR